VETVRASLAACAARLKNVTDTPEFEAQLLAAHAWGMNRTELFLAADSPADGAALAPLIERRLKSEPIAYILGTWEFFSLDIAIQAPLLVPRPETEHLVEAALAHIGSSPARVLDLCTGTGCVALAIAKNAKVAALCATDCHPVAVDIATANARSHGVPLQVFMGDLFAPVPPGAGPFDIIVSNPPYVPESAWEGLAPDIREFEDPGALLSGSDGLDCIRRIVAEAPDWLAHGGLLALETGEEQGNALRELLAERGFARITIEKDLAGHDRIATGVWP